jgi:1,4-dihydroxy-2-naphthoyl-CoA hydrolase
MSIWLRTPSLEQLNAASAGTMLRPLGIVFTELCPDFIRAAMPVDDRTRQPFGLLHGGASVALAETLGSIGAAMHAGPGRMVVGLDINATHHRSMTKGIVIGTATPIHLGRSTAVYEIVISDEAGRRVCTSRITCLIR